MKKLLSTASIFFFLMTIQSQAFALTCKNYGNGATFTIVENVPQKGFATIKSGDNSMVVRFKETLKSGGCFVSVEKVYFHPYYEIKLGTHFGQPNTRCAGGSSAIYSGDIEAEMQEHQKISCTDFGS